MDISKQLNTEVDVSDADFASVPALAAQAAARLGGTPLLPNADGVIVLPTGVSLDDVEVVGRDLVIRLADGQVLVIPDGAVFVPQIAVDGVVVPPLNLAALLTGNEPQPAAGTVQSSGGNFADPADPLQDAYGLGDLLPYTELAFPEPQQQEVLPVRIDREPDVVIQDGGPIGRDVIDNVSEVGLPGTRANGAVESPGSSAGNGSDSTTGTIFVTSPDGIAAITINGVTVTGAAGQQIVTPTGVLTLGALVDGQIGYTYTLGDNTSGDATTDVFTVAITDTDGDVATARLTIEIADDVPTARDDTAEIFEGDADNAVTFDVDTNDTPGADGTASRTFASLTGTYGTIAVNADGTQTYTLTPAGLAAINALPPGSTLTDSFTYTLTDGDGDSDPATLVVTLRGTDDGVLISGLTPAAQGGDTSVDEDDLANGSDPAPKDSLAGTGTFTISAPDGVDDLTVGGFAVITNGTFQAGAGGTTPLGNTLTFTAYDAATGTVSYSYTLVASEAHASGDGENLLFENFTVTLTDVDGSSDTDTLSVRIVDDLPAASNDGPAGVVEDGASSVSGSVLGNDASGADTPASFIAWSAGNAAEVAELGVYGTLSLNADGTWSYVLDNSRAATQALTAADLKTYTLDYTMQDADGDVSPATLTITITGANDSASVVTAAATGPDNTVHEAGLSPNGSDAASNSETATGSFTVSATDGIASLMIGGQSFTLAQVQAFATTNGTVDTGEGTLTLTGYTGTAFSGTVSYSYTLKATIDNDSKAGATGTGFDDTIALTVNGVGGTTASDTLSVRIVDDLPAASNDGPAGVVEDGASSVSGSVLGNDASGADTPASFIAWSAGNAAEVAELGVYGTLSLNADGTWSYVLDNSRAATQALTAADLKTYTLDYTMQDADGDVSPATLTITITGANDSASVVTAAATGPDNTVHEAGLSPNGSDAASNSETATGSFTVSATDGIASLVIGGQSFTLAQVQAFATTNGTVDTGEGTLTLTGYTGTAFSGTVSYSYTLKATIDNDSKAGATGTGFDDTIALTVNGVGGTTASDELMVRIVDDLPAASNDGPAGVVEDGTSSVSGSVLGNDASGADAPASFIAWSAGNAAEVAELGVYGTLSLNADGTWSYVLDNSRAATQALTAADLKTYTLDYTMQDADGDVSPATLTITITGANDSASVVTAAATGPDNTVHEAGLSPNGSDAASNSETATGSFTVSATDGIASLVIGGQSFTLAQVQAFATTNGTVDTGEGTLTLTGYTGTAFSGTVSYSYTLKATIDNDSKAGATGTGFDDTIALTVNGVGGTTASDELMVRIVDDLPAASNDGPAGVVEDGTSSVSGSVLGNDASGADAPGSFIAWSAGNAAEVADLSTYGTLSLNADGTWSYVLDNSRAATQALTAADFKTYTLDYTMQDADGDVSPATLTITITGANDSASVVTAAATGPDNTVHEAGLSPNGSDAASNSETATGSFTVSATDGIASLVIGGQSFTLAQVQAFATTNGTVDTGEGTLTLTGYTGTAFSGTVSYSYTLKATIDNDSKAGANGTGFDDTIALTVNGVGGTTASDELMVRIVDDLPAAVADTDSVTEGGTITYAQSTSVLGDDRGGADGIASIAGVRAAGGNTTAAVSGGVGDPIQGLYGTLTLQADGTYQYVADADKITTDVQDVFVYTIVDNDGDLATTTLTIDVDAVTLSPDDQDEMVFEAALDLNDDGNDLTAGTVTGTNPASTGETVTGTLAVAGAVSYALKAGETGTYGTIEINADGSWTYTLTAPVDGDSLSPNQGGNNSTNVYDNIETFTYTATDANGNSVEGTITIDVTDDVPTVSSNTAVQLDDDALTGGNAGGTGDVTPNTANLTGTLGHSFGADGAGSVALLATGTPPTGFTYQLSGSDLLIKQGATTVITVTVDAATGAYTVIQNAAIDHPAGSDENDLAFTIGYRVTDGDGDTADGSLTINVDDDMPTVTAFTVTQSAENATVTVDLSGHYAPGADGVDLATGVSFTQPAAGSVVYNNDGTFTFTPAAGQGGSTSFQYTLTDGDGDSVAQTVTINLQPDTGPTAADVTAKLDDDGLSGSNPASGTGDDDQNAGETGTGTSSEAVWTGTVSATAADGPVSFSWAGMGTTGTVGQESVSYSVSSPSAGISRLTATTTGGTRPDTILFTADLNTTSGAYTITLVNPIMHLTLNGDTGDNTENNASVVLTYTALDSDPSADTDTGTITIDFDDDMPTVTAFTVTQSAENATVTVDLSGHYAPGADDVDLATGVSFTQPAAGSVVYNNDGTFTFTPAAGQGGSTSFQYTLTDGDGDSVTQTVTINLQSDTGPTAADVTAKLDDDGLSGSNPASGTGDDNQNAGETGTGTSSEAVWTGTVSATAADGPVSFSWAGMGTTGTVGQESVSYSVSSPSAGISRLTATTTGGTRPDTILFTADLNTTSGAYTITLVNPIMHLTLNGDTGDNTENNASVVLTYTALDSDPSADTDTGTITIDFDDDMPTVTAFTVTQSAENATVTVDLSGHYAPGADDVDLATGVSFTQPAAGSVVYNNDGTFTFTPAAGQGGSTSFQYTLTDGDGDSVAQTVTINLQPDTGPTAADVTAKLDDDGLSGSNPASGTGDDDQNAGETGTGTSSEAVWTGTVSATAADGPVSFSWAGMGTTGTVGQESVSYSVSSPSAGISRLTATTTGGTRPDTILFTADLNTTSGAYTITLVNPIMHLTLNGDTGDNTENNASVVLTYTALDSDPSADTDTGTITIDFDDDMPVLTSVTDQEGASAIPNQINIIGDAHADITGDINFSYGADGKGSVTLTALTNVAGLQWVGDGTGTITAQVLNEATADPTDYTNYFSVSVDQTTGEYTVQVFIERPVVSIDLPFSNIAPGNYDTVTIEGATFDGIRYTTASGANGYVNLNTNTESVNPSGNGFGIGNNLMGDNEGFLFSSPDSAALEFNIEWQPTATSTVVSWQTYDSASGELQSGSIPVTRNGGEATTHVVIDPAQVFDSIAVRFDGTGQFRVQDFAVSRDVIPSDQPVQFAVTVTDADGDVVSTTYTDSKPDDATTIDLYFAGGAPVPPVVLDLDGDGVEFLGLSAGVSYDYGSGLVGTAWVAGDDGLLARDTGDGLDIVFADDAAGASTDLQGLALAYDSDGDGLLTSADASWNDFGVWQDGDSDGVVDPGEFRSLTAMGINSISLKSDGIEGTAANGDVLVHGMGSFTRVNGSTGSLADVSFRTAVRTAEIGATAIAAAGMGYSTVAAAAAVVGLGEQGNAPATDAGQVGVQVASPAPQTEEASAASLPAEAQAVEQHETPAHSASTGAHEAEAGSSVAMVDLAGHDAPTPVGGAAPEAGTVSVPSLFDGGSGGSFFQAMEALLGAVAPTPGEGGAGGQHAAAAELPVVQDALAEAAGESFVDHLISQFAGADQPGGEVAGGEAAEALHAALGSMLAGLETAQFAFEPISGAHEMEAMAVAAA